MSGRGESTPFGGRRGRFGARVLKRFAWLAVPAVALLQFTVPVITGNLSPAKAAPGPITLTVTAARSNTTDAPGTGQVVVKKGDPVTKYKWLITKDDVGDPTKSTATLNTCLPYGAAGTVPSNLAPLASYKPGDGTKPGGLAADACQWPSTRSTPGALDVVAHGDQGTAFPTLPDGKYLISVTADGFKIDGSHFTVAGNAPAVAVTMQPYPIPLGTLRLRVFKDTAPVDGTYEADAEQGLGGFITHINDVMGEVTTDFYGNRLCTNYEHTGRVAANDPNFTPANGVPLAGYSRSNFDPTTPVVFDSTGAPVIDANDPGGTCYSDPNGDVVIPHIGPNRYTASVVGPQGQQWYQTTTLEGNHDWDMWIAEGDSGFDNELTVGGERVPPVQMGYVPWGYNANGTPKTIAITAASAIGTGAARQAQLTLAPSSTTLRVGQAITVAGVNGLGFGGGPGGPGGAALPLVINSVTGSVITVAAPGGGGGPGGGGIGLGLNPRLFAPDAGPVALNGPAANIVKGTIVELNSYIGGKGGVQNGVELNLSGANVRGPVDQPIVTLSDLGNNDQLVYVKRFGANGQFSIPNVPNGSYQLTFWDEPQNMIIDSFNVTVSGGTVDVGQKGLVDWWTEVRGSVYIDANENGKRDPGEVGVPQFLVALKQRDNSLLDAGINSATTNANGDYVLRQSYPITKWMIVEAFNTRYYTTGVTVKADNEPTEKTYLGAGVDINLLPVIGLSGRIDWGVKPYTGTQNGGIAGTVTYDTTRNELDPAFAVTEPYQPGIPDMTVHLYYPLPCTDTETPGTGLCSKEGYQLDATTGAVKVLLGTDGNPLDLQDPYISETWNAPKGCTARMQDGQPLVTGRDQKALPPAGDTSYQCVEAPMTGWQAIPGDYKVGTDGHTPELDALGNYQDFGQTVNGNYAFADMKYDPAAVLAEAQSQAAGTAPAALDALADPVSLPSGKDFVVKVDSPKDLTGQPIYKATAEEDVNVFDGDVRMPQENYPLSADEVQPDATVDPTPGQGGPISQGVPFVSPCVGVKHEVHVTGAGFLGAGGSPFEYDPLKPRDPQLRASCDSKLIAIRGNQAVAPNFNFFTEVPLPTHFWGLTINDLGLSHDPTQIGYGEAQPLPGVPMGIYDYSGRLVDTVITDYNGMYEATEPSTSSYNCPLPAGPCPGMYYFKGNDPGQPGKPNPQYNPRFRTIGTNFQAWPGLYTVTDTAPTQVAQIALTPGSDQIGSVDCSVSATTPDIMSVSTPYMAAATATSTQVAAQTNLTVTNVRISGFFGNTRTVRVAVPGLATPFTPPSITIPTLTTANAGALSVAQRNAINAVANPKTVTNTGVTAGTRWVEFTVTGGNQLNTGNGGLGVTVTGVSTPAYTVAGTPAPNTTQQVTVNGQHFGAPVSAITVSAATAVPATRAVTLTVGAAAANLPAGTVITVTGFGNAAAAYNVTNATVSSSTATTITYIGAATGNLPASVTGNGLTNARVASSGFGVSLTPSSGTTNVSTTVVSWTDTQIVFRVTTPNANTAPTAGIYQLGVTGTNGVSAVNGLSFHILGTGYNPRLLQVNPPANAPITSAAADTFALTAGADQTVDPETAIQRALDRAALPAVNSNNGGVLVVVWPGASTATSPTGDYYENLIVHSNVKLQGVGPGGFQGTTFVPGTRINGLGFAPDNASGANWIATLSSIVTDITTVPDAAVITVLGDNTFDRPFKAAIDGVTVTGGAQQGQATALNAVTGGTTTPVGAPGALVTQGGGIYVHTQADGLRVSNNIVVGNSGSYAGGIRIGTPYTATGGSNNATATNSAGWSVPANQRNDGVVIWHNRLRDNGGTNLAGGIGIFDGSDNYVVDHNDICGNFSAEYGGGISHYGLSDGGRISFNRVYLNGSQDEGGGIMIAGELNPNLTRPSAGAATTGAGPNGAPKLTIDGNVVDRNLANDDGGGIRFLSAGNAPITVANNMVTNNLSTHEGGGFALDDSTNLTIAGNTVARNVTTATAVTSNGLPAPAGLSTAGNSSQLQLSLGNGAATYSRPTLRNNLFSGNLAGRWDTATQTVKGINPTGVAPDAPNYWDMGSIETLAGAQLPVTNTVLQANSPVNQIVASATNVTSSDAFVAGTTASSIFTKAANVSVIIETSRTFPSFRQAVLVADNIGAPDSSGDYHLFATSPARNVATLGGFPSLPIFPATGGTVHDIDGQTRPIGTGSDAGADERS